MREQAEKQKPQNYLQPCPDSYRDFFDYFLCIKTKKVICSLSGRAPIVIRFIYFLFTFFWACKRTGAKWSSAKPNDKTTRSARQAEGQDPKTATAESKNSK
jgi:hypothetical protein